MNIISFMDALPFWGILLVSAITMILSSEVGFRIGKRERHNLRGEKKPQTGPIVAASLGLLAFMLAFSFSSVASRYSERKHLSLDEANAIGTTYLRSELLPKGERAEVQRILYDYTGLRIEATQVETLREVEQLLDSSDKMQEELWSIAVAEAERNPTPVSSLFLQSLNELIDLHQKRITVGIHHRMPIIFWIVLYSMVILTTLVGGYDAGLATNRRSIVGNLVVALAFSVVIMLVVALDRPKQRLVSVNQAAMIDLQEDIRLSMQLP